MVYYYHQSTIDFFNHQVVLVARIWISKLLDEKDATKSTRMSTEIQQQRRICQNGGKGSNQTGTVLCGIHRPLYWLPLGFHAVYTREFYLQTS